MISSLRKRLTFSNLISMTALFVALGGAAVAAGLPRNSVGPRQLKRGAVTKAAIRRHAVTSGKLARRAVTPGKLAHNAVGPGNIGNGAVTTAKIGAGAVIARSLRNGVITTHKLHPGAVTANKIAANAVDTTKIANGAVTTPLLANGAVTPAKLSANIGPFVGTLHSGQTLRGVFDLGGEGKLARDAASFQFPLLNPPAAPATNVLAPGTITESCAGLGGGATPQAAGGQLCLYITAASTGFESVSFDPGSVNRLGFGLLAHFEATGENFVQGQWAVTAP